MVRGLVDAIVLFLLPFGIYAIVLMVQRRYAARIATWRQGPLLRLVAAGLALVVMGALLTGIFSPRYKGDYIPAHLEHGTLIPGQME